MKTFFEQLQDISDIIINPPIEEKKIIICQQELHHNNLPLLPQDICSLLQLSNGINLNGSTLLGIHTAGLDDIVSENLSSGFPSTNLIIGHNEFDLLVWNIKNSEYEIIDKSDGEVLINYTSTIEALKHILKIDNV